MMAIMRMRGAILTIAYFISGIFPGEGISVEHGKLSAIHPFLFLPQFFFASWPISMPGGGMYTWPALSLYLTTTDQCWPGAHRPQTHKESARKGGGMPKT